MKNISVSLFRQMLDLISKREFKEIGMKYAGDKRKQPLIVGYILCR